MQMYFIGMSVHNEIRYSIAYDVVYTKFQHNADRLLKLTKNTIGKSPKHFTTDELPTYRKSFKRVFGKDVQPRWWKNTLRDFKH